MQNICIGRSGVEKVRCSNDSKVPLPPTSYPPFSVIKHAREIVYLKEPFLEGTIDIMRFAFT